jgi:hypothetical protein
MNTGAASRSARLGDRRSTKRTPRVSQGAPRHAAERTKRCSSPSRPARSHGGDLRARRSRGLPPAHRARRALHADAGGRHSRRPVALRHGHPAPRRRRRPGRRVARGPADEGRGQREHPSSSGAADLIDAGQRSSTSTIPSARRPRARRARRAGKTSRRSSREARRLRRTRARACGCSCRPRSRRPCCACARRWRSAFRRRACTRGRPWPTATLARGRGSRSGGGQRDFFATTSARVILSLDSDFLQTETGGLRANGCLRRVGACGPGRRKTRR